MKSAEARWRRRGGPVDLLVIASGYDIFLVLCFSLGMWRENVWDAVIARACQLALLVLGVKVVVLFVGYQLGKALRR